jgi:uncharacterized ferritin-like protein (DUF455 family)
VTGPEDLFALAEQCLASTSVEEKLAVTARAADLLQTERLVIDPAAGGVIPISFVCCPVRPMLVDPRELPRRRATSPEGRAALLHAVAHIEFTAIQLAWDLLYRFRGLPMQFYRDWLGVAAEEAVHFGMIRKRLAELGYDYGDFPAHRGLWEVAEDTVHDLAARLALVPRCMEARGLDVTPAMIGKLERVGEHRGADILRRILQDEVGHVLLGTQWFQWICREREIAPEAEYFALLRRFLRGEVRGPYNRELRLAAGFSDSELAQMDASPASMRPVG